MKKQELYRVAGEEKDEISVANFTQATRLQAETDSQ